VAIQCLTLSFFVVFFVVLQEAFKADLKVTALNVTSFSCEFTMLSLLFCRWDDDKRFEDHDSDR
jgi:hypothetical protein